MKKVLIFGGTTEGRVLAKRLADSGVFCIVCVATEYGKQVIQSHPNINVLIGRKNAKEMSELYQSKEFVAVIDATHPYAFEVTENILESLKEEEELPYFRLERGIDSYNENKLLTRYENVDSCVDALLNTTGKILLTTGSKELVGFCKNEKIKERLVVRVLPGKESIDLCYQNGLLGNQIIAMQGPFSKEMNLAIMQQYKIQILVTKESGKSGGLDEKLEAAKEQDVSVYMIGKPNVSIPMQTYSMEEVCQKIGVLLKIPIVNCRLNIVLAGVGIGTKDTMTCALLERIEQTDYLFGASRMLLGKQGNKGTYEKYLAKDVLPAIEEIQATNVNEVNITILFSGDSGFYSGTQALYQQLLKLKNAKVEIWPGVSSLSYLASKLSLSWQNWNIVSTHGVKEEEWSTILLDSVKHEHYTFFLSSGVKDIVAIGKLMMENELPNVLINLGYQLSYENEAIVTLAPVECQSLEKEGLYCGVISNNNYVPRTVAPGIKDELFIRDQVPMTKEEIRAISICKLGLKEDSVVYDVGSGTGSIAIEMALRSPKINVYAIETNELALSLIENNKKRFQVKNIQVIEALAPEGFENLPLPDMAFIGGSKGRLLPIIEALYEKNPSIRVVVNAVSLETINELSRLEHEHSFLHFEMIQLAVTRTKNIGKHQMLLAENPVWICTMQFCGDK